MNHAPNFETAEVSDAQLDYISGGLDLSALTSSLVSLSPGLAATLSIGGGLFHGVEDTLGIHLGPLDDMLSVFGL